MPRSPSGTISKFSGSNLDRSERPERLERLFGVDVGRAVAEFDDGLHGRAAEDAHGERAERCHLRDDAQVGRWEFRECRGEHALALHQALDAQASGQQPDLGNGEEHLRGNGQRAEAVHEFLRYALDFGRGAGARDALVQRDAREAVLDVVLGEVGVHAQFHAGLHGLVERASAAKGLDGLLDEADIGLKADFGDEAVLLLAQEVAGPADFEVAHGELVAAAEVGELLEGLQAGHGFLRNLAAGGDDEESLREHAAAPDAAAHLVKLADAEVVRVDDDDGVRVGHVEAGLDDARAHEDIELAAEEGIHHAFQVVVVHLAVRDGDAGLRHERLDFFGQSINRLHAVVHDEHLAAAGQLVEDRVLDDLVVALEHDGLDGQAVHGRRVDERDVADAGHAEVQGARNRRGAHAERVDGETQLAELFLLLHAELLFLVDDEEAQVLELVLGREQRVRSDDDVDLALAHALEDFLLFLGALVAVDQSYVHCREGGEAVAEILVMLGGEDGRRHEDGHLFLGKDALEGGAHGDFRLAEPDVAADEAVHGLAGFHVALDVGSGLDLVRGGFVLEGVLEFLLELAVGREAETFHEFAASIKVHKFARNLHDLLLHALFLVFPVLGTQAVELERVVLRGVDLLYLLEVGHGELEAVAALVFEQGAVHHAAVHLDADKAQVAADAVVLVGDEVAAVQRLDHQRAGYRAGDLALAGLVGMAVEDSRLRQEGDLVVFEPETFGDVADKVTFDGKVLEIVLQAGQAALRRCHDVDSPAGGVKILDFFCDGVGPGRGEILFLEVDLVPVRGVGLDVGHVEARAQGEIRRKLAHLEPERIGFRNLGFGAACVLVGGLVRLVELARRLGEHGKFLEHERRAGQIVQKARGERLVTVPAPPDVVQGVAHHGRFAFGNRELAHREQVDKLLFFYGALAEDVEGADGFHLVAEELDTDGVRVQEAVHVHNAAADGELAHPAHHGLFDEPVIQEPGPELGGFEYIAHLDAENVFQHGSRLREFR